MHRLRRCSSALVMALGLAILAPTAGADRPAPARAAQAAPSGAPAPSASAAPAPLTPSAPNAPNAPKARDEGPQRARELLARWLAAQNQRSFTSYQALYAASFSGIKRVAASERKLDRAAWLTDRKAMFKAAMTVEASEIAITTDATTATIELTQRWEQGTFADVGRKRIVIDLRPAAGPILSEQMLSSRPILSREACLRAVFPDARRGRIGRERGDDLVSTLESYDLGTEHFGCLVGHRAKDDVATTFELAAVARSLPGPATSQPSRANASGKAPRLHVRSRETLRIDDPVRSAPDEEPDERTHALEVELVPLASREAGLLVTEVRRDSGNMRDDGERASRLLRATADGLSEVLAVKSQWSGGEEDEGVRCDLRPTTQVHAGFFDLDVSCVSFKSNWHAEDPAEQTMTESTETITYRWDGRTYQELRRTPG